MHETVVTVILLVSVMLVIEGISIITRLFINSGEESVLLNPVVIITPDDDRPNLKVCRSSLAGIMTVISER